MDPDQTTLVGELSSQNMHYQPLLNMCSGGESAKVKML